MNVWLVAAAVFLATLIPLGISALRGAPFQRVAALELASVIETLILVLLAEGFDRDVYFELAVAFAVLSFIGNLVYVRLLEHWV